MTAAGPMTFRAVAASSRCVSSNKPRRAGTEKTIKLDPKTKQAPQKTALKSRRSIPSAELAVFSGMFELVKLDFSKAQTLDRTGKVRNVRLIRLSEEVRGLNCSLLHASFIL